MKLHVLFLALATALSAVVVRADGEAPETEAVRRAVLPGAIKAVWAKDLKAPQGLARDKDGNVYVAEFAGGRVAKLSPQGALLQTFGKDLKSPAFIRPFGQSFLVSERKANRVLILNEKGEFTPLGGEIIESLGVATSGEGAFAIAHTTSRILELTKTGDAKPEWKLLFEPLGEAKRYGYRCLALDADGSLFITDETANSLLLLTPKGRLATFARDLDDPTGVTIASDGTVYVAEEGAGGRIARLDREGNATTVAEGLGKPRDILFLDAKTMLVSDRQGGQIWKVVLP